MKIFALGKKAGKRKKNISLGFKWDQHLFDLASLKILNLVFSSSLSREKSFKFNKAYEKPWNKFGWLITKNIF